MDIRWFVLVAFTALVVAGCPADGPPPGDDAGNNGVTDAGNNGGSDVAESSVSLDSIDPASGPAAGGTEVTLTGSGFADDMSVRFGTRDAASVTVDGESSATATTPSAGQPGAVTVTVENPDGTTDALLNSFTYTDTPISTIDWCMLQAQSPVTGTAGEPTDPIYAVVFAEGLTPGQGSAPEIEGQIGWGKLEDGGYELFQYTDTTFNVEKDGPTPGDMANDEYGAPVTAQAPGTYRYVARFRVDQPGAPWVYCDLDGSDDGVSDEQLGTLEIEGPQQAGIDFCQLQPQSPVTVETGQPTEHLRAVVYAQDVTDTGGQGSGIEAELGFGAVGTDHEQFAYGSMTYTGDVDGINPGDMANDEYGATLTVSTAGDYRYAARFRMAQGNADWVYCDLDGSDDGVDAAQLGELTVEDPPQPTISFCETETATASATTGNDSDAIRGLVYSAGSTPGAGQGSGVMAQLAWGPQGDAPPTWTNTVDATYVEDVDGLVPGDQANDRYEATINAAMAGDYEYAYRFSVDGGNTWSYCDTDGSDGTQTGFEAAKLGALTVTDMMVNLPDECSLRFPQLHETGEVGQPIDVFGRVTEMGITGMGMADPSLEAELLVGPVGTDPVSNPGAFTQVSGTINTNTINLGPDEDEYQATFTPTQAGDFTFLYRFSVDGGTNWRYCDIDGTGMTSGAFDVDRIGWLHVESQTPDLIDYCHVWQDNLSVASTDSSPPITVEVYEDPLTVANNGSNSGQLDVEVGYGPAGTNPALPGAYTWNATPLPYKGLRVGYPNNYEYEGQIYPDSAMPAPGDYDVVVRVKKSSSSVWTYCDTNENSQDFEVVNAAELTVTP